jgi:hypothetical protein
MAKGSTIRLEGDKELLNMLSKLPSKSKDKRFWRMSARAAANPIVKSIRSKVPIDLGDLKRSVKYKNYSNQVPLLGGYIKFDHWSNSNTMTNPSKGSILVHNRKTKPLKKTHKNFMEAGSRESGSQSLEMMAKMAEKFMQREIKKLLW